MSLINSIESKEVGWEEETISTYPTKTAFNLAISNPSRLVLIRWYRFLRGPHNRQEKKMINAIRDRLHETYKDPETKGVNDDPME